MDTEEDHLTARDTRWTGSEDEPATRSRTALVYVMGMLAATACGSAFVIGGMVAGAKGFGAVVLAGTVPMAALLWALVLAKLGRRGEMDRWPDDSDPGQGLDR